MGMSALPVARLHWRTVRRLIGTKNARGTGNAGEQLDRKSLQAIIFAPLEAGPGL